MGAVIKLSIDDLPEALNLGERQIRQAISRGALAGAHRGRAIIVKNTPTDQGQLRAGWRVTSRSREFSGFADTLAELINDAPHITIVELGAKPHKVSREGWMAIYEWARRHYRGAVTGAGVKVYTLGGGGTMRGRKRNGALDPDIERITWAIVAKIKKKGQKATLFVRNSTDDLREVMGYELHREIGRAIARLKSDGDAQP